MPFAVELHIDERAAFAVREVWQALVQAGVPSQPLALGARPHISLCVYDSIDSSVVAKQLENFACQIGIIPFQLDTVEAFDGSNGVAFLASQPSEELFELHVRFHKDFACHHATASRYYLLENWQPHCTVAENLSPEQVSHAIEICRQATLPIRGLFVQIGLTEFRPIKEICVFHLGTN